MFEKQGNEFLLKGSYLPKLELKNRLQTFGANIDPLDDHKTTLIDIYDTLIKEHLNQMKIPNQLKEDERNYEYIDIILSGKKRRRTKRFTCPEEKNEHSIHKIC